MSRRMGSKISIAIALALGVAVSGSAIASEDERWLAVLRRETDFTNGIGKGSRPGPSSIQRAFTSLVRHRGTAAFLALTTSEESAPRLFGLCGLKQLDAPEYADVQRRLVEDREAVRGHVGCIRVNDTVGGVLAHEYGKSGRTVFDVICSELIVK